MGSTPTEAGSTVFTLGGTAAAGMVPAAVPRQPSAWLACVSTEDIDGAVEAVATGGGTVLRLPIEVRDRGRMALAADAEGAVFAVWQCGTVRGAQVGNEPGAVCWHDIASRDPAAAATFYGKVFG